VDFKGLFEERFRGVLDAAWERTWECLAGERWGGNALLMVVDAALDSTGLSYFGTVVPRVKRFREVLVEGVGISTFRDFAGFSPDDPSLLRIFGNRRAWSLAVEISRYFVGCRNESDFEALRGWAESADPWRLGEDPVGRVKGVGLVTFQYLRVQVGVDTFVPDKIVKRAFQEEFGLEFGGDLEFIEKIAEISREIGVPSMLFCWAVWLKKAGSTRYKQNQV